MFSYFICSNSKINFKIRPPIDNSLTDNRLILKGANCEFRSKDELIILNNKLTKELKKHNIELDAIMLNRTNLICNSIKNALFLLELNEITNKGKTKWLYLFNEDSDIFNNF